MTNDMHVLDFVRVLQRLQPHLPISDRYEVDRPQLRGAWWSSQQEHMIQWFADQRTLGAGVFTRQTANASARVTYNRLFCPAAFIWMAEALGESPAVVQCAADAARNEPNARKRPGLLRRHLPWERIAELAWASAERARSGHRGLRR